MCHLARSQEGLSSSTAVHFPEETATRMGLAASFNHKTVGDDLRVQASTNQGIPKATLRLNCKVICEQMRHIDRI